MRFKIFFILLFVSVTSYGQLYINEFMASNASTIKDPDYNSDADWIELYNAGNSSVNLNGYFLTDNLGIPNKWKIGNVTIAAKGFALFWADGNNTGKHTNFKLDAQGEEIGLFNSSQKAIDTIRYPAQYPDLSYGRDPGNLFLWGFFNVATPNLANNTDFFTNMALNEPIFNIRGGLYNSALSVTLFTDLGGQIRYTTDGSEPNSNSSLYVNPITVAKTTVVRARIFKPEMLPGPIITNTYFINESLESGGLPVVSLSSDPKNFWDAQKGIYVQNFKPDWEIPVNIELFENNGSDRAAFNEQAGVKINGLYSWQLPQKMLGVYFKKRYGTGTLDNTLFYDSPRSGFKTFALRASGNDWSNTLMRDILGQNSTQLNMHLDISHFRWCTVYFNGRYMGIHNFREKIETDYIEKYYGLEAGSFDMVENEDYAECGDLNAYNELKVLFSKDLSVQANYDAVAAKMDIENFTDLVITEMASGNSSVDHNVMAWKPKNSGKWKWILMDLDRGFFDVNSQLISFYIGQTSFPFKQLMNNKAYKNFFGKKLADHLYASFNPEIMKKLIENHRQAIAAEITRHIARWLGTTSPYGNAMPSVEYWNNEISKLNTYVEQRPAILLNDLNNYGFSGAAQLTLSVFPENAGSIKLNGLNIAQNNCTGKYLKNVDAELTTEENAGYTFQGWSNAVKKVIVSKQSVWKYLDNGSAPATSWTDSLFNDSAWKSGQAELGYGDGDEKTIIGFGSDSQNKFITTYFRHNFQLAAADLSGSNYQINLLVDDGAIVYLNGTEIIRENMGSGVIGYKTLASGAISGSAETEFKSFNVDRNLLRKGNNELAVEVHQNAGNSSDISFDMELVCFVADTNSLVSTNKKYPFSITQDLSLVAVYESNTTCVVPPLISRDLTLYKSCSPYVVPEDVTINSNVTLTIEPGVEIWMSPKINFFVHGSVNAIGTSTNRITFKINPAYPSEGWGALNFWNTSATSNLTYVVVDDATIGPVPARVGAVSAFYGNINLDHILIDKTKLNPISARYSDISLTNSYIHSSVTSDLINVKYGHAKIENCTFVGNAEFDSDGIDYDGITDGIIRNTKIYNILGNNADAIDIGEEAKNVVIDSVYIFNAFDKGVSVGQRSSVILNNSLLVNCNMGAGVKDSSLIRINHCLFYGNGVSVNCYEKNPGRAGGNAIVKNSILSNASIASYLADDKSTIRVTNSLSDNTRLPADPTNHFGNPLFTDPTHFDFSFQNSSPAIGAGSENGQSIDLGNKLQRFDFEPDILICQIYLNPLNSVNPEYLALYNPSVKIIDVSNFTIDRGVTCTIPQGTLIMPGDTLFVTSDASKWSSGRKVVQWTEGKLSNEGEVIELLNQFGMVADFVAYSPEDGWPEAAFKSETVLTLINPNMDNHFPESWKVQKWDIINSIIHVESNPKISVYPNPASGNVNIWVDGGKNEIIEIYSATGQLINQLRLDSSGKILFDLSNLNNGIYLVRAGRFVSKLMVSKP